MELNPQQSYKSVSEMHDRLTTYRQLEAEVANLRAQLSATQAREAMLVEALQTCIMVDEGGTERIQMFNLPKVQHALRNSAESSDQWLHEKLVEMLGESIGFVGLEPDTPLITQRGTFMPTNSTKKAAMMFKDVELGTPLYALPKR